jgi:hypothetical protein
MTSGTIAKPQTHWYREPWPWILISLPLTAVIAGIATLIIAIENQDGLVAEDYYKQGLAINRVLARETRASDLGLSARMMVSGKRVRIQLDGKGGFPDSITLRFVHPTRAGEDREVDLDSIATGWYEGILPPLANGHWRLQIEDAQSTWRLDGTWTTAEETVLFSSADASR